MPQANDCVLSTGKRLCMRNGKCACHFSSIGAFESERLVSGKYHADVEIDVAKINVAHAARAWAAWKSHATCLECHQWFSVSLQVLSSSFQPWRQGHAETARLLLDASANVNAKLTDGSTPLALAAWKGHAEVVKLLLTRGANYRVCKP